MNGRAVVERCGGGTSLVVGYIVEPSLGALLRGPLGVVGQFSLVAVDRATVEREAERSDRGSQRLLGH
ncbi:hypothetical protein INP57_18405 [Saccharopolyspora sp. HNM0986]|uniref:hypothetical protein n=1 Tax=Saccharopolyspora galaxeae TaxID=2781241 RepID=UPI001909EF30|nr:hypothetical protein [Saccharopolyspora sp. HNM0986]MBK0868785.1 hypothetical protein [Saccharopolyspora sp. HNM0986]